MGKTDWGVKKMGFPSIEVVLPRWARAFEACRNQGSSSLQHVGVGPRSQKLEIPNKCFIRRPAMDIHEIIVLRSFLSRLSRWSPDGWLVRISVCAWT